MTNYAVDDMYGNLLTAGVPEEKIAQVAQAKADALRAPVWYYRQLPDAADVEVRPSVRVEPSPDPKVVKRQRMERSIVRRVVLDALKAGWTLDVDTGDDEPDVAGATKAAQVMPVLMDVDEALLILRKGKGLSWVKFVFGNDGWDVICDYTTDLDELLAGANALADRLEERANR